VASLAKEVSKDRLITTIGNADIFTIYILGGLKLPHFIDPGRAQMLYIYICFPQEVPFSQER
jgi:hypothetical protein